MMPFQSEKQRRLMYAAAAGKSDKISPAVAQKFIAHSVAHSAPKKKVAFRRKAT